MAKSREVLAPFQPSLRRSYQATLSFASAKWQSRFDSKSYDPSEAPIPLPTAFSTSTASANAVVEAEESQLEKLPMEIMQHIASYVEDDKDLENFRCSCPAVNNAIDESRGYFWRCRFIDRWEAPRVGSNVKSGADFKIAYRRRNHVLNKQTRFQLGDTRRERNCLEVLRDMILDSYSGLTEENKIVYESRNLKVIKSWTYNEHTDILYHIFKPSFTWTTHSNGEFRYNSGTPLLQAIQVALAPIILDLDDENPLVHHTTYNFPKSQQIAYATANNRPIIGGFTGLEVDMDWALHQLNFWKYHMIREEECTLFAAFQGLADGEQPTFHTSQLTDQTAPAIGKHWKGAYAFVTHEDIVDVRDGNNEDPNIQDEFNSDEVLGDLQDLTLALNEEGETTWNPEFERHLSSLKQPAPMARTRAQQRSSPPASFFCQQRSFRFGGSGEDAEEGFHADGWFNQLPPQSGIPGWQRMTMMKYYTSDEFDAIDYNSLWAYEGLVLPGGKIIVGRWWSPTTRLRDGEIYSGPFILWCVDAAHVGEIGNGEDGGSS